MRGPASCPPLAALLLAALWLALGRLLASGSLGPGCDNGKLHLDRDLPADAASFRCSTTSWSESVQRFPSIDTQYDPEPARPVCMDNPILYNHSIPNSGAFRPVMAESGEYLYCPPQRWLNNLHHGAFVLLYHPCSSLRERRLLSGLARSCLPFHIVTPHPQLSRDKPVALVSWGRTLELSTVASSEVCNWLETTQNLKNVAGRTLSAVYNLLLTRSAGLQRLEPSAGTKDSVRQCCQRVISALLSGATGAEPAMKLGSWKGFKEGRKNREIRAAIGEKQNLINRANETANNADQIDRIGAAEAAAAQNHSGSSGTASHSLPGLSDPNRTPPSEVRKQQASTLAPTSRPGSKIDSPQHEGTDSVRGGVEERSDSEGLRVQGKTKQKEVVDVEEREAEREPAPGGEPPPHRNTKSGSASESQAETHQNCSACVKSGAGSRAAALNVALQRTPRTDEAVWAAAALGFLLVLLTLSVLHTRLYRHWRTSPSLYWHNPHQDYDSVADVIRRRLRIAKKRRKRGRRKECVLLPSSDENP